MRANVPFSLLAAFALTAGLGVAIGSKVGGHSSMALAAPTVATASAGAATQEEQTVISVARSLTPVVVSITVPNYGSGSGAIIRRDGMILTNAHVVANATTVRVGLADGRTLDGTVLGRDPTLDVAVVRVPANNLPAATLGNSDALQVGQLAIAIGNPLGLDRTVTTGVVSALNRSPTGDVSGGNFIQTDAAISPGNSGGPLLNSSGQVIGINSAELSGQGVQGLGFAIPINLAMEMANQVLATGHYVRPFIGIGYDDIDSTTARYYGLPVSAGVMVAQVQPGSPAAVAGIRPQDIIVDMDGQPVRGSGDLGRILRGHKPGDAARFTVVRPPHGTRSTVTVKLGQAPT